MRYEEEREVATALLEELPVVQRGNHSFPCAGRSDDEVPVAVVTIALDRQGFQHPLLMRVRPHVEVGKRDRRCLTERAAIVLAERELQLLTVDRGVVRLEVLRRPVTLEGHSNPIDDMRGIHRREPDIPLQPIEEGGVREIRRPNEGS